MMIDFNAFVRCPFQELYNTRIRARTLFGNEGE